MKLSVDFFQPKMHYESILTTSMAKATWAVHRGFGSSKCFIFLNKFVGAFKETLVGYSHA